jgi:transcriptional regulator with XRE-family HTH domain
MSKSDFGKIVAMLRKERRNEFDETMTQYDLAEQANMPLITLQKIEQGRQANLKPEMVVSLASALDLSSFSRLAFFQASLGLGEKDILNARIPLADILEEVSGMLAHLQTPGFISNCFGDLLLVNPSFLQILSIQPQELNRGDLLCKYNIHRIYYSPEFEDLHQRMGDSYPVFARRRILLLKAMTLRHRNHPYFLKIIPELNRYPKFREHWQSSSFHNEDIFMLSNQFHLIHPQMGLLKFVSFPIQVLSEETDLYLFSYQALDQRTARVCTRLAEELGTQPIRLNPWLVPPALNQ